MAILKRIIFTFYLTFSWQTFAAEIDFSGFATISGGLTFDEDEPLYGFDEKFNFDNGSLFALQASTDLGDGWGVTTQLLARGAEAWDINAEWAYISYDASDNWRLLMGRQRVDTYMYSDYLDVSYAYHWIKPPDGVYSLSFDVFDGIGSVYSSSIGEFDSSFQIGYGRNQDRGTLFGSERDMDFSDILTASWTINRDWLTVRASYVGVELKIAFDEFAPLFDGWRATGTYASIADDLELSDDSGYFVGLGILIDRESYFIVGEFTQLHPDGNFIPQQDSYYLSFGKYFDSFLVHLTYGADENTSDFSLLDEVPAGVDPGLDFLLARTNGLLTALQEDSTYVILGLRWEMSESVALKVEYTDYQDDDILGIDSSLFQFALTTVF
jgi:hypothetical protein